MRKLDTRGSIHFEDVSGSAPKDCPIEQEDLLARFHARENGVIYTGAAAFAAMWRAIPILRPIGLLARNRFVLKILEKNLKPFEYIATKPKLKRLPKKRNSTALATTSGDLAVSSIIKSHSSNIEDCNR